MPGLGAWVISACLPSHPPCRPPCLWRPASPRSSGTRNQVCALHCKFALALSLAALLQMAIPNFTQPQHSSYGGWGLLLNGCLPEIHRERERKRDDKIDHDPTWQSGSFPDVSFSLKRGILLFNVGPMNVKSWLSGWPRLASQHTIPFFFSVSLCFKALCGGMSVLVQSLSL